jgi:predicted AAA+ superfamily ATPase
MRIYKKFALLTIGFKISENLGNIIKNAVVIELLRRKSYWFKEW